MQAPPRTVQKALGGVSSKFGAQDHVHIVRNIFVQLRAIAMENGFDSAWRAVVDPYLAWFPALRPDGAATVRTVRWLASASVVTTDNDDDHDDDPDDSTKDDGRQLTTLTNELKHVREDLRRVLAQTQRNATPSTGAQISCSARPLPLRAAPARADAPDASAQGRPGRACLDRVARAPLRPWCGGRACLAHRPRSGGESKERLSPVPNHTPLSQLLLPSRP